MFFILELKPNRIDLFEDFLYIAFYQKNLIRRMNKFGNGNYTNLETGINRIADLVIFQEHKQLLVGKFSLWYARNCFVEIFDCAHIV